MIVTDNQLAKIMKTIRHVPDSDRDDAWRYVASRLRPILEINDLDVRRACTDATKLYGRDKDSAGLSIGRPDASARPGAPVSDRASHSRFDGVR